MKDHFKMAFGLGKAKTVDVVHIYNGMSLSHKKKNKITVFAATWVDVGLVILSEVRQKHKHQMVSLPCGI